DLDTEINERKESESLELINKPTSQLKNSDNSDLSEKELTTQVLIEKDTEKISASKEKAESFNIP
ncbi:574_t:CDS:2, partial [Scutellospora calospora]